MGFPPEKKPADTLLKNTGTMCHVHSQYFCCLGAQIGRDFLTFLASILVTNWPFTDIYEMAEF